MTFVSEQQRRAYLDALGIELFVPRTEPALPPDEESLDGQPGLGASLDVLREQVKACTRCKLSESRTQTVFGVGNPSADWFIVGEAPGAEEDRRGEPFVGRAGKLLDEMLRAVGQSRQDVFIANVLKCRPPNNRDPAKDEAKACRGYLDRQIELVAPQLILVVGRIAAHELLETDAPVGRLRGRPHELGGIPLVVTYHPAYLLRSPAQKAKAWDDLRLARRLSSEVAA